MRSRVRILVLTLAAAAPAALHAQDLSAGGDLSAGKALAMSTCAHCHVVAAEQAGAASDIAPTFASIARRRSTTAASLVAFLHGPHVRMPEFNLTNDQMRDVAGYILSLKQESTGSAAQRPK